MNSDGTFTDIPLNNTVYWHQAHHHYHFDGWGKYELWTKSAYDAWIASGRTTGAPSYTGVKTTSCITDEEFITSAPNAVYPGPYGLSGCDVNGQNQIHMGLSVGWGDTYDWYRQDQWIDLNQNNLSNNTTYVLRSVADPQNIVYESAGKSDTTREGAPDNEATTTFSTSGSGTLVDSNPPTGTVSINHVDASTQSTNVSVDVIGRDDVSGVNQFRLSNNGTQFTTFNYTSSGSVPTTVAWNLADAATGGSSTSGIHTVYAQVHDNAGNWGPTFTDTINLGTGPPPPPPPTGTYAQLVANDGPLSYWRLNETSGTNAADSDGSNPGVYTGSPTLGAASLLTNDGDKAATFSGSAQYVRVASSASLSLASTVSLEAWIKPTSIPAAGAFASVLTKPESYSLQFNGPKMEFTIMQAGTRRRLQTPAALVAGTRYHVVGTYDGTTQRLYINGALVASAALTGAITTNTNQLNIASWNGSSEFFAGTIDEAAVYGAVLSPTQVANHYSVGTNPAPTQSQLTVSRSGTGTGTVTSTPAGIDCGATCAASFNNGSSVTLAAAPASGSVFAGWSGGGCGGTAGCTLTLSANTTVTATFNPAPSTLTVLRNGAGSGNVTSAPAGIDCGVTCASSFAAGTSITLTAASASGSLFSGWSGGGCTGTAGCTLTLNANTTVTATFAVVPFTLTVTPSGTGSGTVTSAPAGIDCGATCASSFGQGTSITLTAASAVGSAFTGWSGGGCTGTGTCTLTLNADTTVTATFDTAPPSTLTVTPAGTGSGTVTSAPTGINCGATCASSFRRYAPAPACTLTARRRTATFSGLDVHRLVGRRLHRHRRLHAHTQRRHHRHCHVQPGVDLSPGREGRRPGGLLAPRRALRHRGRRQRRHRRQPGHLSRRRYARRGEPAAERFGGQSHRVLRLHPVRARRVFGVALVGFDRLARGVDQAGLDPGRGRVRVGPDEARVVLVAVQRARGWSSRSCRPAPAAAFRHPSGRSSPVPCTTSSGPTTARRNACTSTAPRSRPPH